jgi:exopolysaccharide production protein ExoZ
MASSSQTRTRLDSIDGYRGFACLVVFCFHAWIFVLSHGDAAWKKGIQEFTTTIVDGFFLLSGFLIYRVHSARTANEECPILSFYLRRAFRILPVFWMAIFLEYVRHPFPIPALVANLGMYFGFVSYRPEYIPIAPSWSLFVEAVFYVFFPLIFVFLKDKRIVAGLLIASIVAEILWQKFAEKIGVPSDNFFIHRFPLEHFHYFFAGILSFSFSL